MSKFHGECHKSHHYAGHAKDCTCGKFVDCQLVTDDPALFYAHALSEPRHGTYDQTNASNRFRTPQWVRDARKPWKAARSNKPWDPKPFDVGDTIRWVTSGSTVLTGQVWSGHYAPKTRWVVAESIAFEVHERDLVDNWLDSAHRHMAYGKKASPSDYVFWRDQIAQVEHQLLDLAERELVST